MTRRCRAVAFWVILAISVAAAGVANAATVTTDRLDYPPGDTVRVSGSGYWGPETITLQVVHYDGNPLGGEGHDPWKVRADSYGRFMTTWVVPYDDNVGETLLVRADGRSSGLHAEATFADHNTRLTFTTTIPNPLCAGDSILVCAKLEQACAGGTYVPLVGRDVLLFSNPGNCSADMGIISADTVPTDASGIACAYVDVPLTPGTHAVRGHFRGEAKPDPCPNPGNSACDPSDPDANKRCVDLSASNSCQSVTVIPAGCCDNQPPVVTGPADQIVSICSFPARICLRPFTYSDPNNNIQSRITNKGTLSGDSVCYTATTANPDTIIVMVTDSCGASDFDTVIVTKTGGGTPTIAFGPDTTVVQCAAGPICKSYTVSDPDGLAGLIETLIDGPAGATIDTANNKVCFTPATSGSFTIIAQVTDSCGAPDFDTVVVSVDLNDSPVCNITDGGTFFQCAPTQVCLPASATDADGNLVGCAVVSGPGSIEGGNWCYTPTGDQTVNVTVRCTDACGASCEKSFRVTFDINDPPTIAFDTDTSVFQCTPAEICRTYTVSDPNGLGKLVEALVSGPAGAVIDTANNRVCFTPAASGNFTIIASVTDSCGATDVDTVIVTVDLNDPPVCNITDGGTFFQCTPTQVCLPASATDADGNLLGCTVTGGPGSIVDGNWCYTPTGSQTVNVTVRCADACGAFCEKSFSATFVINGPPTIAFGADTSVFQCNPAPICRSYAVSDPNGLGKLTEALVSGPAGAVIDTANNRVCFTPVSSGSYTIIAKVTDSCGAIDVDTVVVTVDLNDPPVCSITDGGTIFQCVPTEVCLPASATDADGNLIGCTVVSGPGSIAGGNWCYTPTGSQTVNVTVRCTDACGASCEKSFSVTFVINGPPTIAFGVDTSVFQCTPAQICRPYTISDPNGPGKLVEALVSGPTGAVIDTANNRVCFTPAASGSYTIIAKVTDSCGAMDLDTVVVTVDLNDPPVCSVPSDTTIVQCAAAQVCLPVSAIDPDGNLTGCVKTSGPGTLSGGNWCYTPTGDQVVSVTIRCTDACGAFCEKTFQVTFTTNDPPTIAFGADTTVFQCTPAPICRSYSVSDPDGPAGLLEILLSGPPGAVIDTVNNRVCFTPAVGGNYKIIVKVSDPCKGMDVDTVVVSVRTNNPPFIQLPKDTSLFLCDGDTICFGPIAEFDLDNNGAYDSTTVGWVDEFVNKVCFVPDTDGVYTIIVCLIDSCGAMDCDTMVVTVDLNEPPVCEFIPVTPPLCTPDTFVVFFTSSDPDGNLQNCVLYGPGQLDGHVWRYAPVGGETIDVTIRCYDACGDSCEVSFHIAFPSKQPPICQMPNDTTIFQCTATEVCLPAHATSIDPPVTCEIVSGPGTLANDVWCYTPTGEQSVTVVIRCTDVCNAVCEDSFKVTFALNDPPICSVPKDSTISQCNPVQVCLPVSAVDPDGNLVGCAVIAGPGAIVGGNWCYTPTHDELAVVTIRCTDACGASCEKTFRITFQVNDPPIINLGPDTATLYCLPPQPICRNYTVSDLDGLAGLIEALVSAPTGTSIDTALNRICFTPTGTGNYTIIAKVTDPCGAVDFDTLVVTVNPPVPPVCNLPRDTTISRCEPSQVCLPVSATGGSGPVTCTVVNGPGVVQFGFWCYTPPDDGTVTVTIRCTDACGGHCEGTFMVIFRIGDPPSVVFGRDSTLFQCVPAPICVPYAVSDPDGLAGLVERLISGPPGATLDSANNRVCFTPTGPGVKTVIVEVEDGCYYTDRDTIGILVDLNDPPICRTVDDTTISQCAPAQICINVTGTDPDNNFSGCVVTAGPGTVTGGNWCYTPPPRDTTVCVTIRCTDACGATCDESFCVTIRQNHPPVCNLPKDTTIFQCAPAQVCLPVSATDPDGNLSGCSVTAGPGTVSGGNWCYTPTGDQAVDVTIRCTDACGAYCEKSFRATFVINDPPVCPPINDTLVEQRCVPSQICLSFPNASDPNGNFAGCAVTSGPGQITNGQWCWTPPGDTAVDVTIRCTDACGAYCEETFRVTVDVTVDEFCGCPIVVSVNGGDDFDALSSQTVVVPIQIDALDRPIGGFDLLLCYDVTAMSAATIQIGSSLDRWEYFTFRFGAFSSCGVGCPPGILRIITIADLDNGASHPPQTAFQPVGPIAFLKFVITQDRNFINHCAPIRFCWFDCGDNVISSKSGDTTYFGIAIRPDTCVDDPKRGPVPAICFVDGRVCIRQPPDDRGDLNLNDIANEVGDAVLYTNFFIYGPSVWDPTYRDNQILASDVNDDGLVLTVADLIYLIRIITGDVQPFPPNPKLTAVDPAALETSVGDDVFHIAWTSTVDVGGAHFVIDIPAGARVGVPTLADAAAHMDLKVHRDGNQLRVLVFSEKAEAIPSGRQDILTIPLTGAGNAVVSTYDLSTADGQVLPVVVSAGAALPTSFAVEQNYPNPFNTGTIIRFSMAKSGPYSVTVYDITGRRVWNVEGEADGRAEVFWDGRTSDGRNLASGIYLYRVVTEQGTDSRKMTLLK